MRHLLVALVYVTALVALLWAGERALDGQNPRNPTGNLAEPRDARLETLEYRPEVDGLQIIEAKGGRVASQAGRRMLRIPLVRARVLAQRAATNLGLRVNERMLAPKRGIRGRLRASEPRASPTEPDIGASGTRHEIRQALAREHPDARILENRVVYDQRGEPALDSAGRALRLDFVVVRNGRVIRIVEASRSPGRTQARRRTEDDLRRTHSDLYVRDDEPDELHEIGDVISEILQNLPTQEETCTEEESDRECGSGT